jgi:hypothetical protein
MNIDITTYSVEQLKAMAYDLVVALEQLKNNLVVVQKELQNRTQSVSDSPPDEVLETI